MRYFYDILTAIWGNKVFVITFFAWLLSCLIKGLLVCAKERRLDITRFMGPGGMPSSHSTLVTALAVSVGRVAGFGTPVFAITCALALVVMYDASGIRRAAGQQAQMINKIMEAWDTNDLLEKEIKLKELLGHTPLEVLTGAILGLAIGFLWPI